MSSEIRRRFRTDLFEWGAENYREFPWREPDRTLYEVFVAEFFLTQTPAENVETVYPEFVDRYPSLGAIDDASADELRDLIRPLGFYNMRTEALKQIAADNDTLPEEPSELETLPRVGQYVANATVCFARERPLPIVDRNIERIYSRVFGELWPETPEGQTEFAADLVPESAPRVYNLALLDFGAAVCRPEPQCESCFATAYCDYYRENG